MDTSGQARVARGTSSKGSLLATATASVILKWCGHGMYEV